MKRIDRLDVKHLNFVLDDNMRHVVRESTAQPLSNKALDNTNTGATNTDPSDASKQLATDEFVQDALAAGSQPLDAFLTSIAALGTAADKMIYTTALNTAAEAALTAFARTLLDDTTAAAWLTTLGFTANAQSLVTAADYAAMRVLIGLVIGTNVQAYNANLADIAAKYASGAVTYNAAHFTASTGAWTVDSADQNVHFVREGSQLLINFDVQSSDVSATPAELRYEIPNGYTPAADAHGRYRGVDNGGASFNGEWYVTAGSSFIRFYKPDYTGTWALTSADNTSVRGTLMFRISN